MAESMHFDFIASGKNSSKNDTESFWVYQHESKSNSTRKSLVSQPQWEDWQWHVRNQITTASELEKWIPLSAEEKRAIQISQGRFDFSLTPYWASLMDPEDFFCPIRRQVIPLEEEFRTPGSEPSSRVYETTPSVGRLTHLNPGQVVLSLHSRCIVYCRFCPQKKIRRPGSDYSLPSTVMTGEEWEKIEQYLISHPQIREVILSGGETLLLNDNLLYLILTRLKKISSVKSLRLETRLLSVLPQRVTDPLVEILKSFQPLYLVVHVNHPRELTPEFFQAASRLVNQGVPLASQTVLLKDINDKPQILSELFQSLFKMRIRPYRLIQMSPAPGADHFRTTVSSGLRLWEHLKSNLPGLALPEYVADTPGGKIPLRYESILARNKKRVLLKNHEGKIFVYQEKNFSFSS